jgi:hypothetical protein
MTPKKKSNKGGRRPGAGAPKQFAETPKTCSVSMLPSEWAVLDTNRQGQPRGRYIASLLK